VRIKCRALGRLFTAIYDLAAMLRSDKKRAIAAIVFALISIEVFDHPSLPFALTAKHSVREFIFATMAN
jgi:hypothetical protein